MNPLWSVPRVRDQSESAAVVYPASVVERLLRASMGFAHQEPTVLERPL